MTKLNTEPIEHVNRNENDQSNVMTELNTEPSKHSNRNDND